MICMAGHLLHSHAFPAIFRSVDACFGYVRDVLVGNSIREYSTCYDSGRCGKSGGFICLITRSMTYLDVRFP